jgi:hypothetical protein
MSDVSVVERRNEPGVWSVETITNDEDGSVYQAHFHGPRAEERAREYASFKYGFAEVARLTRELATVTAERGRMTSDLDRVVAMSVSMDADFEAATIIYDALKSAVEALGALPDGYCFCSANRHGDGTPESHEPECRELRAALEAKK